MTPPERPDTATRILVATAALVLILSYLLDSHALLTGEPFPVPR